MNYSRYEPRSAISQLQREIERIFGDHESDRSSSSAATAEWIPPADIAEYADHFILKLDVPGVNAQAIEVTLEHSVLTISGERQKEAAQADVQRTRLERAFGRFHRRFTLPETVDAASVRATNNNGVLEVIIPKQPQAQPRRIEVAAAH